VKLIAESNDPHALLDSFQQLADALGQVDTDAATILINALQKGDKTSLENGLKQVSSKIKTIAPGLLSNLAQAQTLNMFFANEAYQSGGPFKHVVYAGQAVENDIKEKFKGRTDVTPDEMKRAMQELAQQRRAELTLSECLDSFNEQLGDFLKDLAHYGDEEPGVAIIQSSKYLDRLIDAASLLVDMDKREEKLQLFSGNPRLMEELNKQIGKQKDIRDQLIAARKGKLIMEPEEGSESETVDQIEQRRAFACDFMKKMGITSVAALGRTYQELGKKVNIEVRKALAR
jgi:hypothetical protein